MLKDMVTRTRLYTNVNGNETWKNKNNFKLILQNIYIKK